MHQVSSQTIHMPDSVDELLIVSDIHGYRQALDGFEKAIANRQKRHQILFCGDLYNAGPHPVECTSWVMKHVIP